MNGSPGIGRDFAGAPPNRLAAAGGAVILFFFLVSALPGLFSSHEPNRIDIVNILRPPRCRTPSGRTTSDGRPRPVVHRARLPEGRVRRGGDRHALGCSSGFFRVSTAVGGRGPDADCRHDALLPTFFLILSVIAFLEPSIWNIMAVIGLTAWMGVARLVRAETLSLKERDFVAAARAQGAGDARSSFATSSPTRWRRSWWRPRSGGGGDPHRVRAFLPRIGVPAADPVVGEHPHLGKDNIEYAWWLSLFPGLAILVTVLGTTCWRGDPRRRGPATERR